MEKNLQRFYQLFSTIVVVLNAVGGLRCVVVAVAVPHMKAIDVCAVASKQFSCRG